VTILSATSPASLVYPESDGLPMADNSLQMLWIVILYNNLEILFGGRPDVFVGGNLMWYPVEGQPEVRNAPDVLVVFGRPPGYRGSYQQWEEGGVPITVVFEVLSPGNTATEMDKKFLFYEDHGVEEYYLYDPAENYLQIYRRQGEVLRRVRPVQGFVSPHLGIRFDVSGPELVIYRPDGTPFLTAKQLDDLRAKAEQRAKQLDDLRVQAEERASQAERLLRRLRELSRKARLQQATAEELAELERLEAEDVAKPG
jgi:Uma2 family endonuclease